MPEVASTLKPRPARRFTAGKMPFLSSSRTETKTVPDVGTMTPAPSWLLAKADGESPVEAHDLAGRAHLRSEQRVDAGEAGEGEDSFLDRDVAGIARVGHGAVMGEGIFQRLAGHDAGGDLGDGTPDGLGDEGHGARGARVDLEHVDRRRP